LPKKWSYLSNCAEETKKKRTNVSVQKIFIVNTEDDNSPLAQLKGNLGGFCALFARLAFISIKL
jgi:hypothetical protein